MWYLAETLCLIHARAMDEHRVEEQGVALFHLYVHSGVLRVVATDPVVHLVYTTLRTNTVLSVCTCAPQDRCDHVSDGVLCTSHSG